MYHENNSLTETMITWILQSYTSPITPKQRSSKTAREISPSAWEISPSAWEICGTVGYCSREWQLCSDSADVTSQSYDLSRAPWRPGSIAYGLQPYCTPLNELPDHDLRTFYHPTTITCTYYNLPKVLSKLVG